MGHVRDLPPSGDDWWGPADKKTIKVEEPKGCEHLFRNVDGTTVECVNCHVGYMFGPNDKVEVKDGKLIIA